MVLSPAKQGGCEGLESRVSHKQENIKSSRARRNEQYQNTEEGEAVIRHAVCGEPTGMTTNAYSTHSLGCHLEKMGFSLLCNLH